MSEAESMSLRTPNSFKTGITGADRILQYTAFVWFIASAVGQLIFFLYIVSFYGRAVIAGDLSKWNKVLYAGYIPGDHIGNTALAIHLTLAAYITLAGPLQLLPQLRNRYPALHRWIGRTYVGMAVITSVAGALMLWARNTIGDLYQHLGTSLDAMLIVVFAAQTLRYAMAGKIATHRRYALRLFIAVSASWFFRVGLMFWIVVNQGPAGFDPDTFQGPALSILAFAESLLPLAVLEIYLRSRASQSSWKKIGSAIGLFVLTVSMCVGIFGATMGMWIRHI